MAYPVPIGRNGVYGTITCGDVFPEHVEVFIREYGLRQILNDAVSQKEDKDGVRLTNAEIFAKAKAKYEQLVAGELRAKRESTEPTDPVEAEAYRIAKSEATTYLKSKGAWPKKGEDKFQVAVSARMKALKKDDMTEVDYLAVWIVQNPTIMDRAKVIFENKAVRPVETKGL
jgi:hypothetical protein